ncbi:MAG: DUF2855 family protein [Pseudomonadota bacterium]
MTDGWSIHIDKDDIRAAALKSAPPPAPAGDAPTITVKPKQAALTANNITYAVCGKSFGAWTDMPGYWSFFPSGDDGAGLLPIWGYAEVTTSNVPEIEVGEALYGYFPMASELVMQPKRIAPGGFFDGADHRQKGAAAYNQYIRLSGTPDVAAEDKDLRPVFHPLFITGYLIADQLEEERYRGADAILFSSASSKTAMTAAFCTGLLDGAPQRVGLTSKGNAAFVRDTGFYDEVVVYDDIPAMETPAATYVDMAGSRPITRAVHGRFGDALKWSLHVGMSHWDAGKAKKFEPAAPMEPFFAPGRIKKRVEDWGPEAFFGKSGEAWASFLKRAATLGTVRRVEGPEAMLAEYRKLAAGEVDPREGVILAF